MKRLFCVVKIILCDSVYCTKKGSHVRHIQPLHNIDATCLSEFPLQKEQSSVFLVYSDRCPFEQRVGEIT